MTVAKIDEGFKVQSLETWFDPLEMFTPKDIKVDGETVSAESADKMVKRQGWRRSVSGLNGAIRRRSDGKCTRRRAGES